MLCNAARILASGRCTLPAVGDRLAPQVEVAQEFAITGSFRRGMIGCKGAAALLRIVVLETRALAGRP